VKNREQNFRAESNIPVKSIEEKNAGIPGNPASQ
jgi:hypothetical protein